MKNKRNTSKQFSVTRRALQAITPQATLAACKAARNAMMAAGVPPLKARVLLRAAMEQSGLRTMFRGSENIFARTAHERRRAARAQARPRGLANPYRV